MEAGSRLVNWHQICLAFRRGIALKERFSRIEATGVSTAELAEFLRISESELARWIIGKLPAEEMDIIEVGLMMFAHCGQSGTRSATPTVRLALAS